MVQAQEVEKVLLFTREIMIYNSSSNVTVVTKEMSATCFVLKAMFIAIYQDEWTESNAGQSSAKLPKYLSSKRRNSLVLI